MVYQPFVPLRYRNLDGVFDEVKKSLLFQLFFMTTYLFVFSG